MLRPSPAAFLIDSGDAMLRAAVVGLAWPLYAFGAAVVLLACVSAFLLVGALFCIAWLMQLLFGGIVRVGGKK